MNAIGQPFSRIDGRLKTTGAARYTADIPIADVVYGVLVQSTIANGRTVAIDSSAAEQAPGVLKVFTHGTHEPDAKAVESLASARAVLSSAAGRQDSVR